MCFICVLSQKHPSFYYARVNFFSNSLFQKRLYRPYTVAVYNSYFLMLSILGKNFSRQHFEVFFFLFFRKQTLAFHANDNLHELSKPVFWEKEEF